MGKGYDTNVGIWNKKLQWRWIRPWLDTTVREAICGERTREEMGQVHTLLLLHFIVVPCHRCFRLKLLGYPKDSCSRVGLTQLYKHLERSQWSTPNGLMVADLSAMRCCQIRRETPHDIPTMASIFHDPIKTTLDMTWGDYASYIPILHLQPPIPPSIYQTSRFELKTFLILFGCNSWVAPWIKPPIQRFSCVFQTFRSYFLEKGVPLNHPFFLGIFHKINHPAIGVPPFMETSIWINDDQQW